MPCPGVIFVCCMVWTLPEHRNQEIGSWELRNRWGVEIQSSPFLPLTPSEVTPEQCRLRLPSPHKYFSILYLNWGRDFCAQIYGCRLFFKLFKSFWLVLVTVFNLEAAQRCCKSYSGCAWGVGGGVTSSSAWRTMRCWGLNFGM